MSFCFSPSGRYIVSGSDIGERAIRIWLAEMPLYDREPAPLGLRLRWARSGLIKRVRASAEPSAMAFFLNRQQDRESRESSDESAGEKVTFGPLRGQGWGGERRCSHIMHGRSHVIIDPCIPTMPGRSMSGFHRPGRHCLHQERSTGGCWASRMKGEGGRRR